MSQNLQMEMALDWNVYFFFVFNEVSAIRKPKMMTFSTTGSQILFCRFHYLYQEQTKKLAYWFIVHCSPYWFIHVEENWLFYVCGDFIVCWYIWASTAVQNVKNVCLSTWENLLCIKYLFTAQWVSSTCSQPNRYQVFVYSPFGIKYLFTARWVSSNRLQPNYEVLLQNQNETQIWLHIDDWNIFLYHKNGILRQLPVLQNSTQDI